MTSMKIFRRNTIRLFFLFGLLAIGLPAAQAAVELIYFRGRVLIGPAVRLEWATGSESDTAGFLIKRDSGSGPVQIPVFLDNEEVTFIPAAGDAIGAAYAVEDENVLDKTTYTYFLYEVDTSNLQILKESFTIVVDEDGNGTGNSSGIGGRQGGSGSSRATATPTRQASSTPTPIPGSGGSGGGSTGGATPTPRPTLSSPGSSSAQPQPTAAPIGIPSGVTTSSQPNGSDGTTGSTDPAAATTGGLPGVAVAQAQEGYPSPEGGSTPVVDPAAQGQPESYVPPEPLIFENQPAGTMIDPASVQPLGGSSEPAAAPAIPAAEASRSEAAGTGRLILWGSFLASLLIFVAGIAGALILFQRRSA